MPHIDRTWTDALSYVECRGLRRVQRRDLFAP